MNAFTTLLARTRSVFRAPSYTIFTELVTGWVLTPGRRTVTGMLAVAGTRAHDAYHRLLRDGAWAMSGLWRMLAVSAVARLAATGVISVDIDDTLFHKSGRHIDGAGTFRDAVRSTARHVVYATGLNVVVLTLRVRPPWGGMPIALPINARLHRKGDATTTVAHAAAMLHELADWLPGRDIHACADGAYATLAGEDIPRVVLTSRMRRDAALYEPAPARTGRRGRPRSKGARLPTPPELARAAPNNAWQRITVDVRGRPLVRLAYTCDVLWYAVRPRELVRLVVVRDPTGVEPDDFFVTTDLTATATEVASRYAGRWSIEVCFRDTKQDLGGEQPQSWRRQGPERAACLSLWLHGLIWCWYLDVHPDGGTWPARPWYRQKSTPSFLDALAALRRLLWAERITQLSSAAPGEARHREISQALLDTLAYAA